jgi:DNA-binding winged helix-turn-helix (wHTH) protein
MVGALELQFGPFRLLPQQRVLLHSNTPLRLGSRAREILFALVERAGEIVMKNELIARVWPDTIVEEGPWGVANPVYGMSRTLPVVDMYSSRP